MVGSANRQWYRMGTAEVLNTFGVDMKHGLRKVNRNHANQPTFLPKNTWQFYKYTVFRDGTRKQVAVDQLVEGDVVTLSKGDVVPATMRLLRSASFAVCEDHLHGSASPTYKNTFASKSLLPKSQQKNMLFAGSEVVTGTATAIVVQISPVKTKQQAGNRRLQKHGVIVQTKAAAKALKKVDTVIFDDLQQKTEIIRLVQKLYLEQSISTVFFVQGKVARSIKGALPESAFIAKPIGGIAVYVDVDDAKKAKIVAAYNNSAKATLYIHRGEDRGLLPKIATINLVIARHASHTAVRHADLIAERISVDALKGILYNKK